MNTLEVLQGIKEWALSKFNSKEDAVVVATLPTASSDTMGRIYYVGPDANDNYTRWFSILDNGSYSWVPLGSTQIDLTVKADKDTVPTDVTRTQTDATIVNSDHESLFYLRQATSSLAGLMTAAEHNKLDSLPDAQTLNTSLESIIYDVSAKNPTAGPNNDGKFTLAYILDQNNVDTLIPTAVRKGGMSIKFVQSSDNNYIQFRYIGAETTGNPNPFLDTANWQGVDEEPTDGSKNIVKSGGIYTWVMGRISTAISTIKEWAEGLFAKTDGYYESMTVGRADNLIGEPIPVTTGYTTKHTGYDPSQPELEFADGLVKMTEARGRVTTYNQAISIVNNVSRTIKGVTFTSNALTQTVTLSGSNTSGATFVYGLNNMTNAFNITIPIVGHVYMYWLSGTNKVSLYYGYYGAFGSKRISTAVNENVNFSIAADADFTTPVTVKLQAIDLTILNPTLAAKANLTVAEVEDYLASIRTPKPYIKYNAGTLLGARLMGWQLRKTANLLNPTTGQAILVPYNYTGHNNEYTVNGWSELTGAALQFTPYNTGVAEAVTLDSNNRFVIPSMGVLEVVEAEAGTAITGDMTKVAVVMTYDTTMDGEIVAYEQDNVQVDSAKIYYKDGGNYVQVFENGIMKSTGDSPTDVHDGFGFDEIAKKWQASIKVGSRAYESGDESDTTVITDKSNTWYPLATPVTHDTLYYKVGNEYLPMEEVFPNGIQGMCCNWATETLVEQAEVDGQPQSITPVTTEVFQSDYKELLKTIGDTYISKEQAKNSFDNFLTVLDTNSGTALGGSYATDGFNSDGTIKFKFTANA